MNESLSDLIIRATEFKQKQNFTQSALQEQQAEFNAQLTANKPLLELNARSNDALSRGKVFAKLICYKDEDENHGVPLHGDALYADLLKNQVFQKGYSTEDNIARLWELGDALEEGKSGDFKAFLRRVAALVRKPLELQEESVRRTILLELSIAEQAAEASKDKGNVRQIHAGKKNKKGRK